METAVSINTYQVGKNHLISDLEHAQIRYSAKLLESLIFQPLMNQPDWSEYGTDQFWHETGTGQTSLRLDCVSSVPA